MLQNGKPGFCKLKFIKGMESPAEIRDSLPDSMLVSAGGKVFKKIPFFCQTAVMVGDRHVETFGERISVKSSKPGNLTLFFSPERPFFVRKIHIPSKKDKMEKT